MAIVLPFRVRANKTREKLDRRKEGVFMLATLRPAGAALWIGFIAYIINPASMAWSSMPLANELRWAGVPLILLGNALILWALPVLGANLTDTVVTRERHTLVTRGPYRWIRHPFYDAMAILVIACALIAANWFVLLAGALVFMLLAIRVSTEEAELEARFGAPYREYRAKTGMFLPR